VTGESRDEPEREESKPWAEPAEPGPPEPGAEPGEPAAAPADELAATRDQLLRLTADFDNYRKRMLREREEAAQYGPAALARDLLPVLDNLERALDHARQAGGDEGLARGVELVARDLLGVLSKHGISEIQARGAAFDPREHEAVARAPDASVEPGTVIEVFEKGYRLRDRLLRPARVVVSAAPAEPGPAPDERGD
jgi:molecular chaperone GrpE